MTAPARAVAARSGSTSDLTSPVFRAVAIAATRARPPAVAVVVVQPAQGGVALGAVDERRQAGRHG